ncbi:MAG: hypothetical protein ABIN91_06660 [Mucilaginibacter sp.]|uniref:hypothetical protein n=1 Tax=Mucilaginibacter sp. TaxID=1882438 RepID=UPI003266C3CB
MATTNEIKKSTETKSSISVNNIIYDLQVAPAYTDPLVLKQRKDLLLEIDLDELNDNLYLSVELLFVAYNGVAGAQGGKLQAEINDIMGALALLCNRCVGTMNSFKIETENIISQLGQTYRFLVSGNEKLALAKLKRCGVSSKVMATDSEKLSSEFMELQKRSVAVRSNTIIEETSEYNRKLAAEKAIRELEAKQKAEKVNQEELVAQVANLQAMYDKAQRDEDKAADRSLILGITSAICGAIGAGLGAFAAAKNPAASAITKTSSDRATAKKIELAQAKADEAKTNSDKANKKLLGLKDKVNSAKTKLAALETQKTETQTEISIIEGVDAGDRTKKQKADLDKHKKALVKITADIAENKGKTETLQGEMKLVEKSAKDLSAEYGAASASLEKLSGGLDKMADAASSAEESIRSEKMAVLEKKFAMEAEKRKSLVAMAEFAENIKNSKVEQGNAEVSINSLHAAIEAMGKIVGTLTNASLFWKQMADYCSKMSEKGFQATLQDIIDPDTGLDLDERVEHYQDLHFMSEFLFYICQWVALNGLSGEYLISTSNAQKKCVQNLAQSPTIENAKKNAPELAKKMGIMLNQRILDSTNNSSNILQEQARLETAK